MGDHHLFGPQAMEDPGRLLPVGGPRGHLRFQGVRLQVGDQRQEFLLAGPVLERERAGLAVTELRLQIQGDSPFPGQVDDQGIRKLIDEKPGRE